MQTVLERALSPLHNPTQTHVYTVLYPFQNLLYPFQNLLIFFCIFLLLVYLWVLATFCKQVAKWVYIPFLTLSRISGKSKESSSYGNFLVNTCNTRTHKHKNKHTHTQTQTQTQTQTHTHTHEIHIHTYIQSSHDLPHAHALWFSLV